MSAAINSREKKRWKKNRRFQALKMMMANGRNQKEQIFDDNEFEEESAHNRPVYFSVETQTELNQFKGYLYPYFDTKT